MESSDCCSICLENMTEDEITTTECSHKFHTTCLQRWNKNSCPICRRTLNQHQPQRNTSSPEPMLLQHTHVPIIYNDYRIYTYNTYNTIQNNYTIYNLNYRPHNPHFN
jgi:hypothetical protein